MKKQYVNGRVLAEWSLDSYQYIDPDGKILEENLSKEALVQATVQLSCEIYQQEYVFSFVIE